MHRSVGLLRAESSTSPPPIAIPFEATLFPFTSIWTLFWIAINLVCPFGRWGTSSVCIQVCTKGPLSQSHVLSFVRLLTVCLWPCVHFCLLRWIFTLPGEPSTWRPPPILKKTSPLHTSFCVCVHSESNMLLCVCLPVSDGFTFCVQSERCLRFVGCSLACANVHYPSTVLCVLRLPTAL